MEFPALEASWILLIGWLYQQTDVSPESLTAEEVQRFIRTHTDALDGAVDTALKEVLLDDISVQRLKESNYVFSGIKTFHELNEAFPSLLDEEGNRKPFNQFLNDVQKVYDTYNVQYLRTEYNFAQTSALMAARWKKFEQDGDRYYLQYRTVGDKRVRRTHRMLHNITLPITSPFWDKYFPPNGWNCRCTVVQVRKDKYPASNEQEAMNLGSQATAGKYQEMFMFNPGKRMTTFPAYNGYTLRKCNRCEVRPDKMKLAADIPDNEVCRACRLLQEMRAGKERLQEQRKAVRQWAKENLVGKTVLVQGIQNPVEFTSNGIKEALNQPHKFVRAKNEAVYNLINLLKDAKYVLERPDEKGNPMVMKYHYLCIRIADDNSFAVIRELVDGRCQFYSIVEKLKKRKESD